MRNVPRRLSMTDYPSAYRRLMGLDEPVKRPAPPLYDPLRGASSMFSKYAGGGFKPDSSRVFAFLKNKGAA
jgi:hypothetical protein